MSVRIVLLALCVSGFAARQGRPEGPTGAREGDSLRQQVGTLAVVLRSSHALALVDVESFEVIATVPTGKGPHEVAVSSDGRAFVANYGMYPRPDPDASDDRPRWETVASNTMTAIDLRAQTVISTFDLDRCNRPHGIWSGPEGDKVWVTCESTFTVRELDARTGQTLREWSTEQQVSHMVIASEGQQRLYVANVGSGSVTIIDRSTDEVGTVATGAGAEGMALSPDGKELWVANNRANTISIIDTETEQVVTSFASGGSFPIKPRFTPDGREVWVTNNSSRSVSVYDAAERTLIETIELDTAPLGLLISPNGDRAYVTAPRRNSVIVIDIDTREIVTHFRVGIEPDGMAWVGVAATGGN